MKKTRCEENEMVINKITEMIECKPSSNYNEIVTLQLGVIATSLIDISKSLAVLADKKENEE